MGYTVTQSRDGDRLTDRRATRVYLAKWDGTGTNNVASAKQAIATYASTFVQDFTTGAIRQLDADANEQPAATELRLSHWLHGFPADPLQVVELDNGRWYRGTATYTRIDVRRQVRTVGPLKRVTTDDDQGTENPDAAVEVSYDFAASAQGGFIDRAPLVASFARDTVQQGGLTLAKSPPFDLWSLNAIDDSSDGDQVVKVRGLEYQAPAADTFAQFDIQGGEVNAAWRRKILAAARRGTIDTAGMTIDGVEFQPLELMLVEARISTSSSGTTNVSLGFASGEVATVTVASSTGDDLATMSGLVEGAPQWRVGFPSGVGQPIAISPHYFGWTYYSKTAVTQGDTTRELMRSAYVQIHNYWATADFSVDLFGTNVL